MDKEPLDNISHRMSTTNEYSARYSIVPEVTYDDYDLNIQSKNNKQGRSDESVDADEQANLLMRRDILKEDGFELYNEMVEKGVAREIARMHLPLNTYTYFYWKIDLHNLMNFLRLRCDSHAQYEIRQYANMLAGFVKAVCPVAFEAWYDYVYGAVKFTLLDRQIMSHILPLVGKINVETLQEEVKAYAKSIGMSGREVDEFWNKISVPAPQDFSLPEKGIVL